MSDEERSQDPATSDPDSFSSQANSVESIQDSHKKERKVGGGALVVVGIFNLMFGLAGGGFLGIFGLLTLLIQPIVGLMLLATALTAGLQVVASVGMFQGREKSVEFADLLAKLFLIPISTVIMVLVVWPLVNNDRLQEDDILAVAGFALMAFWPMVVIAFAMRRHRLIHARRAKRADDKADQVSGIEVTDDDLLAVKEPEPDSPTPVKPHGTKPKVTLIGCSIFCLFALTFCFVAVLCYAGVRFLMRVDAPAKTPVASYTTPDAATVKKHMTPAQLALGDPAVNSVGMLLVPIPAGEFQMGSPDPASRWKPQHQVKITKPFYLSVYEVTQQQYEQVMKVPNPSKYKGPQSPVELVSWNDAVKFCRKLSSLPEEKSAGYVYRLPTEAEWEYACRAGTQTAYSFGDSESELDYAWYTKNSGRTTHPVGGKKPNAWGLYDMHGNVWECCQDWHGSYPSGSVTDPTGAAAGSYRVLRGGSWYDDSFICRSASRSGIAPDIRSDNLGFRVLRSAKKDTTAMDEIVETDESPTVGGEDKAVAVLKRVGAKVYFDDNGQVVHVDFRGTNVRITDNQLIQFGESGSRIKSTTQTTHIGAEQLAKLGRLTRLNLNGTQITDAGLVHLQGLTKLKELYLIDTQVTDRGLAILAGLPQLETLHLIKTKVTGTGFRALRNLPLKSLWIGSDQLTDAALVQAKALPNLEDLRVYFGSGITDVGLKQLKDMPHITSLHLGLNNSRVTDNGLASLHELNGLLELRLRNAHISDDGIAYLSGMSELEILDLSGTEISDAGLKSLSRLTHLEWLNLDRTWVTNDGLQVLRGFADLQSLSLGHTQLSDAGMMYLRGLRKLETLNLYGSQITDVGVQQLASLTNLKAVDFRLTDVSVNATRQLAKALPDLSDNLAQSEFAAGWKLERQIRFPFAYAAHYNPVDGLLYVARRDDGIADGLYRIEADGGATKVADGDRLGGVVVDPEDGDIFVSEDYRGRIFRSTFATMGRELWVEGFAAGDDDPAGMAIAPYSAGRVDLANDVLVVDRGYGGRAGIWRFSRHHSEGESVVPTGQGILTRPVDITIALDTIYLVDEVTCRVYRVGVDGSLSPIQTSEPIGVPKAIATDPLTNDLYILDSANDRVVRVAPESGRVSDMFVGVVSSPWGWAGLDVSPDGNHIIITGEGMIHVLSHFANKSVRQPSRISPPRDDRTHLISEAEREAMIAIRELGGLATVEDGTVVRVDLRGDGITDAALESLYEFSSLKTLCLVVSNVTDSGLKRISELKSLEALYLGYTPITDAGLAQLRGLTKLKTLGLQRTKVTDEGVDQLQEALPDCQFYYTPPAALESGVPR